MNSFINTTKEEKISPPINEIIRYNFLFGEAYAPGRGKSIWVIDALKFFIPSSVLQTFDKDKATSFAICWVTSLLVEVTLIVITYEESELDVVIILFNWEIEYPVLSETGWSMISVSTNSVNVSITLNVFA